MSRHPRLLTPEHLDVLRSVLAERRNAATIPTNDDLARAMHVTRRTVALAITRLNHEFIAELDRHARELRQRTRPAMRALSP